MRPRSDGDDTSARWLRRSALTGGIAWLVLALVFGAGAGRLGPADLALLLAVLVLVPLGLPLARSASPFARPGQLDRWMSLAQPVAAGLVVVAVLLPAGPLAAACAAPWLLLTLAAAASGVHRLVRERPRQLAEWCVVAALVYLAGGGGWLVVSRLGLRPMGFDDLVVLLTAVHFHHAGFVAPLLVGLGLRRFPPGTWRLVRAACHDLPGIAAIAGPFLLALGIAFSPPLELVAALVLAGGLMVFGPYQAALLRLQGSPGILLAISGFSLSAGMLLAAFFALAATRGPIGLTIADMLRTHGPLNALGFGACGLLGWTLAERAARGAGP